MDTVLEYGGWGGGDGCTAALHKTKTYNRRGLVFVSILTSTVESGTRNAREGSLHGINGSVTHQNNTWWWCIGVDIFSAMRMCMAMAVSVRVRTMLVLPLSIPPSTSTSTLTAATRPGIGTGFGNQTGQANHPLFERSWSWSWIVIRSTSERNNSKNKCRSFRLSKTVGRVKCPCDIAIEK